MSMQTNTDNIVDILPPTTDDLIFGCLSPASLIAYSRTCRAAHVAVISFYRRAFRIENTLRKYFTTEEVRRFRELQEITGTIVSGSTALEFFDRTEYSKSNLNLYVDHQFRQPIATWLQAIGYHFVPDSPSEPITLTAALAIEFEPYDLVDRKVLVFDFVRPNAQVKIQLTTTNGSPLEMVLGFHSSCVMNLIAHDKAYSIFPRITFEDRRSFVLVKDTDFSFNVREKYESRGWTFSNEVQPSDKTSLCTKGIRHLGDAKCWSIALHPHATRTASNWNANSWRLTYIKNRTDKCVWVLLINPGILHYSHLVNYALKDLPVIDYDDEMDVYENFYDLVMSRLSN